MADLVRLFHLAGTMANEFAERDVELRSDKARLRAAMAWADFTRECHLAMVEPAKSIPREARCFVKPARIIISGPACKCPLSLTVS